MWNQSNGREFFVAFDMGAKLYKFSVSNISYFCSLKMKNTILFVFTLFLLTIYSCKKSGIDVDYTILDIHEDMNVQKLIFMNDIVGYACGGKNP